MDIGLLNNYLRLDEIKQLPENWNGNGAPAFSKKHVDTARKLISKLKKQPFISPTAKGSIQFEYEDEQGNYLEFELFPDNSVKKFCCLKDNVSFVETVTIEKLSSTVNDFYGTVPETKPKIKSN